ncbi:MAG: type II toxin-antitoxin system antitoxin SocA domain-containing protein, partial [Myxococcales bacterium]
MTITVHDVCDYTIVKCSDAGEPLSALKLQKLVYYAQAWYLAFAGVPLFHGTFEAWVHGPV